MNDFLPVGTPLRYKISDWRQLESCLSNNSNKLSISVTTFFNNESLNGLRIKVEHRDFGTLFACVIGAKGRIISDCDHENQPFEFEFTPAQICEELYKYGFDIDYNPVKNLPGDVLDLLMTINRLGFDKLRVIGITDANVIRSDTKAFQKTYSVVAFNSEHLTEWLNAQYSTNTDLFQKALQSGNALNVTAITNRDKVHYDWTWLWNMVVNIEDVLADNRGCLTRRGN